MYLLTIYFPLISFLILSIVGRFLGTKNSIIIALLCLFCTFIVSVFTFYEVALNGYICTLKLSSWFTSGLLKIEWGFLFDVLTVLMLCVVSLVSFLVHTYSIAYMSSDPHVIRFMSYLSLFTFFMLILVTSDNYVQLFLGWEGVGLCSYLLVNFWFTREQANKSAMKAIIVNRIGDFFFLLALLLIFFVFKSFDFLVINSISNEFEFFTFYLFGRNINILTCISFFIFLAAVGKSAQLGLHTWLPDAMEGPTPVSALIHAATMVTAGIFLVLRSSFILEFSEYALMFITIFGAMTAIFASTTGLFQNDLKKVIAYSTCSQLGYMFFACGSSNYSVAMFHLFNHAFFKALLFLGAGVVIHALNDEQDMRKMGGLYRLMPFTFVTMFVGSIALAGFPFLSGFYSKDIILETICLKFNFDSIFAYILASIATFFTSFYSFRLIVLVFLGEFKGSKQIIFKLVHDAPFLLGFPLFILSFFSIFVGFICKDMFLGFGTNFWLNSFSTSNYFIETSEFLPLYVKLLPFVFSFLGIILSLYVYTTSFTYIYNFFLLYKNCLNILLKNFYVFFSKKWYFDMFYNQLVVKNILYSGYNYTFKFIDRGVIEIFGPLSLVRFFFNLSNKVSKLQTGFLYHYFFVIIITILLFLFLFFGSFIGIFVLSSKFIYFFFFLLLINLLLNNII